MQTNMNTQPGPLTRPSTNLRRNQTCMSSLDTDHIQFSNTPEDKFQDQNMMIRLMWKKRSTINKKI